MQMGNPNLCSEIVKISPLTKVYIAFGVDHEVFALSLSTYFSSFIDLDVSVFSSSTRKKRHSTTQHIFDTVYYQKNNY